MEYTQEDIDKLVLEAVTPLQNQITELEKLKPVEKTDAEKALEQKEKDLFEKEKNLTLKENGLQDFAGLFNVQNAEELNKQIEDFNKILKTRNEKNNFIPNNHQKTNDAFSIAEKNKDVEGMLKAKLTNKL